MFPTRTCAALAIGVLVTCGVGSPTAHALDEFLRLKASDAANNDGFGYSTSIDGTAAIIGAWKDDDAGADAGSAYLFHSPNANSWTQFDKITASDGSAGDAFGSSVSISGSQAVIGAPLDGGAGSAYIFRNNGTGYSEVDKLVASDGASGDQFGYSVAIFGNTAVVGAWMDDSGKGSAYLFRDNGAGVWNQIDKITPLDPSASKRFGYSVAIYGNQAVIGAPFDGEGAALGGAAYIFQDDGMGNWNQVDKLLADDASVGAQLGTSVGISTANGGPIVIAGASGDGSNGVLAGAAYLFSASGTDWQQIEKLTASDAAAGDRFGHSVAIDGETAVASAYQKSGATGAAYMYRQSEGIWSQVAKLVASDGALGDALGYSSSVSGEITLLGAPLRDGGTDSGAAYLFRQPTGQQGDYNHDNIVNSADYTVWRDSLGSSGAALAADGNGDGVVNQADYGIWKLRFGETSDAVAGATLGSAVPEPSSLALLGAVALLRCVARTRRGS